MFNFNHALYLAVSVLSNLNSLGLDMKQICLSVVIPPGLLF